jgi:hypothetical protein
MALRIRKDCRIVCAAINDPEEGDCYLHDGISYMLTVEHRVIVTTESDHHMANGGEWWWKGQVPEGVEIEKRD